MTDDPFGLSMMVRARARGAAYSLGEQDALANQPCTPECVAPPLRADYRIGYGAGRARALTLPFQLGVVNRGRDHA